MADHLHPERPWWRKGFSRDGRHRAWVRRDGRVADRLEVERCVFDLLGMIDLEYPLPPQPERGQVWDIPWGSGMTVRVSVVEVRSPVVDHFAGGGLPSGAKLVSVPPADEPTRPEVTYAPAFASLGGFDAARSEFKRLMAENGIVDGEG